MDNTINFCNYCSWPAETCRQGSNYGYTDPCSGDECPEFGCTLQMFAARNHWAYATLLKDYLNLLAEKQEYENRITDDLK